MHKRTLSTREHFLQENTFHKRTLSTREHFLQENTVYEPMPLTKEQRTMHQGQNPSYQEMLLAPVEGEMAGNNRSHFLRHYKSRIRGSLILATKARKLSEAYGHCGFIGHYLDLQAGLSVADGSPVFIMVSVEGRIDGIIHLLAPKGQAALPGAIATRVSLRPGTLSQREYQEEEYVYHFRKVTEIFGDSTFHHLKPRRTKRALSLQNFFLRIAAVTLFAPHVGALPSISAAISEKSLASSSASSSQVFSGESNASRSLIQVQGMKILLFLMNMVLAFVILCISQWIYSTFCYSRLRTIDKTRKLGFVCMILYQAAYFHIRDDPNSQRGLLLGVFIASAGFTYKSSSRGAARFDFGLVYAVAGIAVGVFILQVLLAWMTLNSSGPPWDVLLMPCIALGFLLLEIGANCFRVNMRFRDEDELEEVNERLPYYRNSRIRGRFVSGKFWPDGSHRSDDNAQLPLSDEFLQSVDHAPELKGLPEQHANPWAY